MIGKPAEVNIVRFRGDTWAPEFAVQENGSAYDIAGHTFKLSVNPRRSPADASAQAFQVAGVVVDGPGGVVRFPLTPIEAGIAPGVYFFDVQETNDAAEVRTLVAGTWTVRQDITK